MFLLSDHVFSRQAVRHDTATGLRKGLDEDVAHLFVFVTVQTGQARRVSAEHPWRFYKNGWKSMEKDVKIPLKMFLLVLNDID